MNDDYRCLTITWRTGDAENIEVSLGPGVSVPEAHHILMAAADETECVCPAVTVSQGGMVMGVHEFDTDDGE